MIKPNTYTRLHIHFVFAVKYRKSLIQPPWDTRLHEYIAGVLKKFNHHPVCINSVPDHIHILADFKPTQSISDIVRVIKKESSSFINKEKLSTTPFHWQEGYGAFSVSHINLETIKNYIIRQREHHAKTSFEEEYQILLKKNKVDFNSAYIFQSPI